MNASNRSSKSNLSLQQLLVGAGLSLSVIGAAVLAVAAVAPAFFSGANLRDLALNNAPVLLVAIVWGLVTAFGDETQHPGRQRHVDNDQSGRDECDFATEQTARGAQRRLQVAGEQAGREPIRGVVGAGQERLESRIAAEPDVSLVLGAGVELDERRVREVGTRCLPLHDG